METGLQAKDTGTASSPQRLQKAGRILPQGFGRGTAPRCQVWGFWSPNCGRINSCCFKLPNLW